MRGVPAQPGQQARRGRQLIVALRVQPHEAAAIVEIDGALRIDRFGARHFTDTVEQQSLAVAQAVGVGAAYKQIEAGGQIHLATRACRQIAVDEELVEVQ